MKTAPHAINRCPLDRFCWERGLTLKELAEAWGCSHEQARIVCRPFGHPDRRPPSEDLIRKIFDWSNGEITAADHYPPEVNRKPDAEQPGAGLAEAGAL